LPCGGGGEGSTTRSCCEDAGAHDQPCGWHCREVAGYQLSVYLVEGMCALWRRSTRRDAVW
jgi:hypothetical protein